ncbi:MAG: DNA-directed RNA polymerase subunit B, partial [bacterium]|nr:DNA-directed RNA polymerase subunit B [bacterium]
MSDVYLGGKFIGAVEDPDAFINKIKDERRKGNLSKEINVNFNSASNEVFVESGKGRLRRPLIRVKDGKSMLTEEHLKKLQKNELRWSDLVKEGVVEYVDSGEEEAAFVSFSENELTEKHTHLEVAAIAMFGLSTALVPYANFNSAQKVNTGSKNQKQALGFYAANFLIRMDMDVNLLHTPQIPVVDSIMHEISDYAKHPSGQNLVVAVMSYKGYNMEDAIVLNRGSIDRGMGRGSYYRPMISEELRYSGGLVDEISVPDKEVKGYKSERDYRFLEGEGIIYPVARVNEGNVVIGESSRPRFLRGMHRSSFASDSRRESSVALKHGEGGTVGF